jgi:hypothetical protein
MVLRVIWRRKWSQTYNCLTIIEMVVEMSVHSPFNHLTLLLTRESLLDCNLLGNIILKCATVPSEFITRDTMCVVAFVPGLQQWWLPVWRRAYISFVPGCIFSVTDVWEVMEAERGPSAVVLGGDYTVDHVVALVDAVII